jgi:hypothetical protein
MSAPSTAPVFRFAKATAELQAAASRYAPDGAMAVLATINELPEGLTNIANVFVTLATRCNDAFPVHPNVAEALTAVYNALIAVVSAAGEVAPIFRTEHEHDIARHEDPRTGEEMWDTTRNGHHASAPNTPHVPDATPARATVSSAAARGKPRAGDEVLIDGALVTLWAQAPRPATWWAVDDDGHAHLVDGRKGNWTRSPRTLTFFKPGDRVQVRGNHQPPLIGTVSSTYYRASRDEDANIYLHLDDHAFVGCYRASYLIALD